MNQISGEHAEKIYQDMQSSDGFLRHLQEFAETKQLDEKVNGILLSDLLDMRRTISKWTNPLREIALAYRKEKRIQQSPFAAS